MKDISHKISHDKYRKQQALDGIVRYEILVNKKDKETFEAMVGDIAEEYIAPKGKRLRKAKARSELFSKLMDGISHDFFELKDQITKLKAKVKVLSPTLSSQNNNDEVSIPDSILALTDEPLHLKKLISKLYLENADLKLKERDLIEKVERYHRINEVLNKNIDQQLP